MNAIKNLRAMAHQIIGAPRYRRSSFENCLFYDRADGRRVDFTLVHIVQDMPSEIMLHLVSRKIKNNPNYSTSEEIALTMQEARLLRDFLNKSEVRAWIDEEEA